MLRRQKERLSDIPFTIEEEQEDDGRWLTEIPELPGVLAYGQSREGGYCAGTGLGAPGFGGPSGTRGVRSRNG